MKDECKGVQWESEIGWGAHWSGRRVSDLVDVDLFVNCGREEAFTGRSGMNGDGVV